MHLAVDIVLDMVDHIMHEVLFQGVVTNPLVGVYLRVATYFAEDFTLQSVAPDVGNNLCTNFAHVTVKHPHDDGFIHVVALECAALNLGHLCTLALVHVGNASTNKGFVYLDWASTITHLLAKGIVLHEQADSMQHEPCALLSHLHVAGDLVAADTVLAIGDRKSCGEPLLKRSEEHTSEL